MQTESKGIAITISKPKPLPLLKLQSLQPIKQCLKVTLPVAVSPKPLAKAKAAIGTPLPKKLRIPEAKDLGNGLMKPLRAVIKYKKLFEQALNNPKENEDLLKDYRRPFLHGRAVFEFCTLNDTTNVAANKLKRFSNQLGELNDKLRQGIEKEKLNEICKKVKELLQEITEKDTTFISISRRKMLEALEIKRQQLKQMVVTALQQNPNQPLDEHHYHSIRICLRKLMYIHKGAFVCTGSLNQERIFLHLLQLSERMGDIHDKMVDGSASFLDGFLTRQDKKDLKSYLCIHFL